MDYTADTKYHLHYLHLEQYFIQQKHALNFRHLFSITVSILQCIYDSFGSENIQHSMLANNEYNNISIENYYQKISQNCFINFFTA